jgi:hypothetical protein
MKILSQAFRILLLLNCVSAFGVELSDFAGSWEEVGFRCAGEKTVSPNPSSSNVKMLKLSTNYFYHSTATTQCNGLSSDGNVKPVGTAGDKLLIQFNQRTSSFCGELTDDFANKSVMMMEYGLRLDENGTLLVLTDETFSLLHGGVQEYRGLNESLDSACLSGQAERIFNRKQ